MYYLLHQPASGIAILGLQVSGSCKILGYMYAHHMPSLFVPHNI